MATTKKTHPSSAADQIGATLLTAMKDELNVLPNPANSKQTVWGSMSEVDQAASLDRFKRRIRHCLEAGLLEIFAAGVPSVRADVEGVNFKGKGKGIVCSLSVPLSSKFRHELADAASGQVLVVVTPDIDAYLKTAKMVKPDSDQNQLDLGAEDPRPTSELVSIASELAKTIGEADATAEAETWTREHLVDYIQYAEKKAVFGATDA